MKEKLKMEPRLKYIHGELLKNVQMLMIVMHWLTPVFIYFLYYYNPEWGGLKMEWALNNEMIYGTFSFTNYIITS